MTAIAVLELLTGVGLMLFWIGFFTIGLAHKNPPKGYMEYEHSFPLPDGLLAILMLVAGTLLLLSKPWGGHLSLIAAGARRHLFSSIWNLWLIDLAPSGPSASANTRVLC